MVRSGKNTGARARVFLSYSRVNVDVARRLHDALQAEGFDAYLDQDDILPGEPWKDRLSNLIARAEKIVFLVSPASINSEICKWELDHAERLGKTILPLMITETSLEEMPGRLSRLNLVFIRGEHEWGAGLEALKNVLNIDLAWEREKARLSDMALRWENGGRNAAFLLPRDDQVANAEHWRDGRPQNSPAPSDLLLEYITASRSLRSASQRRVMVGAIAIALAAVALSALAFFQRQEAIRQKELADIARIATEASELAARQEAWTSRRNETRALAGLSKIALSNGQPAEAVSLALSAWPKRANSGEHEAREAIQALSDALPLQRERLRVTTGANYINDVEFVPNSDLIASAEGSDIVLRSLSDGSEYKRLAAHKDEARAIAISADGAILLSGADDETALIWDVPSAAVIAEIPFPEAVKDVALSADGRYAAAALFLGDVFVWDVETLDLLQRFSGFRVGAQAVTFAPNSALLAIGDGAGGVYLLDPVDGASVVSHNDHSSGIEQLAFSPDGEFLASAAVGEPVIVRNLRTGDIIQRIDEHVGGVFTLAFSPDGLALATGGPDEFVGFWDLISGKQIERMQGHIGWVTRLAISADGGHLVTGGADGTVRVWNIASAGLVSRHLGEVAFSAIAASPSELVIALGDDKGAVTILDLDTGEELAKLKGGDREIHTIAISPDELMIATGDADGVVRIWRLDDFQLISVVPAHTGVATGVSFSPDGMTLASVSWTGDLKVWNAKTGLMMLEEAQVAKRLDAIAYSPDGDHLAVGGVGGAMVIDAQTLEIITYVEGHEPTRFNDPTHVEAVAFSPDGKRFATAGKDGTARVWDLRGRQLLKVDEQTRPLFAEYLRDVGFSADGKRLFTAGTDNAIRQWDIATGVEIARFEGGISGSPSLAVLSKRSAIAGIDGQETLRVWRVPDFPSNAFALACHNMPKLAPPSGAEETEICNADYSPPTPWWTSSGRNEPTAPAR